MAQMGQYELEYMLVAHRKVGSKSWELRSIFRNMRVGQRNRECGGRSVWEGVRDAGGSL